MSYSASEGKPEVAKMEKRLPFSKAQIEKIAGKYPTPFHIYDEKGIRKSAKELKKAFKWADFREFFAVKATPNPHIIKILREEGFGADCSSLTELMLAERCGIVGEEIMFTSNDTPADEYEKAMELGALINLDDISHIPYLEKHVGLPEVICLRYNPGTYRNSDMFIGSPSEAKYGFTKKQIFEGYRILKKKGVKRFGIHAMLASNVLDTDFFVDTANMLFDLIVEISNKVGIKFEFVNLGGGLGIPYRPEQKPISLQKISDGIKSSYERKIVANGLAPLKIYMENGRYMTGPHGYLVSTVLHIKETYKTYVGLDACMANLMRPAIYGAYHHITVLGKENGAKKRTYDVVGSLCENNDKFAIDRRLPKIDVGDIVVIHDTGAHGHAMGFNYNGKLRSAELLLKENGKVVQIRRAETVDDYFATLDFSEI